MSTYFFSDDSVITWSVYIQTFKHRGTRGLLNIIKTKRFGTESRIKFLRHGEDKEKSDSG